MGVSAHAVWAAQRRAVLPAVYGRGPSWIGLRFLLSGRHSHRQLHGGRASSASTASLAAAAAVRPSDEHGEVRAGQTAGGLPGTPHHRRRGCPHHQARGGGAEFLQATGQEAAPEFPRPSEFLPPFYTGGGQDSPSSHGCAAGSPIIFVPVLPASLSFRGSVVL